MKIKEVKKLTQIDTRRLLSYDDYIYTKTEFSKDNIKLKSLDSKFFDTNNDLRILLSDLIIEIDIENAGVMVYKIKKGFITDLASVPSILRSLVDNDKEALIIPAFLHDGNFGAHILSFSTANSLFKQMIRLCGGSWWLAFKCGLAVNTSIGKKAYLIQTPDDIAYNRGFIDFTWRNN